MVHVRTWLLPDPLPGGASFCPMPSPEPTTDGAEPPAPETRRVQVVARWNSWVQVYDPSDDSLTWVDLSRTGHAPA